MVSLLLAGRALSIVTNTVVRTVAENRGAYSELISICLFQQDKHRKEYRRERIGVDEGDGEQRGDIMASRKPTKYDDS
ncbi:hypothetical protein ALC53_00584 [Atta colombica]|uniref:Uncharacterized protein n=1 Tax=Atta colombica TaxID=520822 RepID=A0A195BXM3_9HYME|nr:hypothetical protein ALC53_00584 [Atta colombica]